MIVYTTSGLALGLLVFEAVDGVNVQNLLFPGATLVALLAATWRISRFMSSMGDASKNRDVLLEQRMTALQHSMELGFTELRAQHNGALTLRDFARWVGRLRERNPTLQIPDPFDVGG